MPLQNSAVVAVYDFGAAGVGSPVAANQVALFRVLRGGALEIATVNTDNDNGTLTFTFQRSADGTNWTALTSNEGGAATNVVVPCHANPDVRQIVLNAGTDLFFRVLATGNVRGQLQVRGGENVLEALAPTL